MDIVEAACNGNLELVKKLVEKGADVNKQGGSALQLAAYGGHFSIVTYLVEKGANIHTKNRDGTTLLFDVIYNGYTDIANFLIESGMDVNSANNDGVTPLSCCTDNHSSRFDIAKTLVQHGANVNVVCKLGWTPLMEASLYGNFKLVRLLLESGAKVDRQARDKQTALSAALRKKHYPVLLLLLKFAHHFTESDKEYANSLQFKANFKKYA